MSPDMTPETSRVVIGQASDPSRRRFLRGGVAVAAGSAVLLLGCGGAPVRPTPNLQADPDKADAIRKEIRMFEADNKDNTSTDNVVWIYRKITELHKAAFGLPQVSTTLAAFGYDAIADRAQALGLSQLRQDVPWGDASLDLIRVLAEKRPELGNSNVVMLYSGNPNVIDPNLNRLSVVRMVGMHEYIHSQTQFLNPGRVIIDGVAYEVPLQRGLKWNTTQGQDNQKAHYFDEVSTQVLAEFMNDPKGEDDTSAKMRQSPLYSQSITWLRGADAMKSIYNNLCIPLPEVRQFHFDANPQGLLDKIDGNVTRNKIVLPKKASSTLVGLSIKQGSEDLRLQALHEIAQSAGLQ